MKNRKFVIALAALIAFGTAACKDPVTPVSKPKGPVALTGSVSIPDTIFLGDNVTADTSGLNGTGTIFYQWQTSDSDGGTFIDIDGAEANSFIVEGNANIAVGRYLRVTVTRADNSKSVSSNAVEIRETVLPKLDGSVSIPKSILLGDYVTASTGGLGGSGAISYQWQTSDSATGTFTGITNASQRTFSVVAGTNVAAGRYLRVTVTRADN
jgi:hypothetical protein